MSADEFHQIGTVQSIARYPLKAAGGQALATAKIGWHGIAGDRQWALFRTGDLSGLPWVSGRRFPGVTGWRSELDAEGRLCVWTADGSWVVDARDSRARDAFGQAASAALGEEVRLQLLWSGIFDAMPLSIVSSDTIAALGMESGHDLDPRRFRANLVIDTVNARAWPERRWLGRELRVGSVILRIDRHTTRCEVIDIDPDEGKPDSDLFRAIRTFNRNRAGVYASPRQVGVIAQGMEVSIR